MKQLLLFISISFFTIELAAQVCWASELYRDSAVGVYPAPYDPDTNPEGGITESACINSPYYYRLTFVIPETVNINGFDLSLDSIVVATEGAVGGLPIGLDYGCNPASCVFKPIDTLACMVIEGTPTIANAPGVYPLTITTKIWTGLGNFDVTFPTTIIPGGDGTYDLVLEDENSSNCLIGVGTNDYLTKNISVFNSPNPFGSTTNIAVDSKVDETLQFRVFDLLGNLVHHREVEIFQGTNNIEFDGTALATGIYNYTLSTKTAIISKKMVISR